MTYFEVIPLKHFIEKKPDQNINEVLSGFSCSKDTSVQNYLRKIAIKHETSRISRTYLIFDSDPKKRLVAYITIAIRCLNLGDEQCDVTLLDEMNVNGGIAQSYLVGQLGKIDGYDKKVGEFAMDFALDLIEEASQIVGCRAVRLDCRDDLLKYYQRKGFRLLNRNNEKDLNRMVMILT